MLIVIRMILMKRKNMRIRSKFHIRLNSKKFKERHDSDEDFDARYEPSKLVLVYCIPIVICQNRKIERTN